jgi:hypothetical protein
MPSFHWDGIIYLHKIKSGILTKLKKNLKVMKYLLYVIACLLIIIWIIVFKPTGFVHLLLIAAAVIVIITIILDKRSSIKK